MTAANEPSSAQASESPANPASETSPANLETGIQLGTSSPTGIQPGPLPPPDNTVPLAPSADGSTEHASEPGPEEKIPLPPLKVKRAPMTPERLAAEILLLDRILVGGVLVLTFLLASYAIQNSDFWMHLATGRLVAQGEYTFGDNPFSNPKTPYWANHAWLFDTFIYGLSSLGGGIDSPVGQALLVLFKALIITGLAWVLLAIRRAGQSWWLPGICTAVAVLAMSPRLVFQPICLSLLFLGFTLYLLTRPGQKPQLGSASARGVVAFFRAKPVWLLPLLFILWVNTDHWFFLGPLTVGLFLLGEWVQKRFGPSLSETDTIPPGRCATLAQVLGVGFLACFINPFHYHAFTLPPEISYLVVAAKGGLENALGTSIYLPGQLVAAGQTLQTLTTLDSASFPFIFSPWHPAAFQTDSFWTVSGMAYYVLVVLGLASFLLTAWVGRKAHPSSSAGLWHWNRFLVWSVFAVVSFLQLRTIPFFAVVAGPITALNFQDVVARLFGTQVRIDGSWKAWSLGGRAATLLAALVLVVMAWPGWLHAHHDNPRRSHHVAWHVESDPLQEETAKQLNQAFPGPGPVHGFNYNWEIAGYCAWNCPKEKTYFDSRLQLFADRAEDFIRIRKSLAGFSPEPVWETVFSDHGINHLLLDDSAGGAINALVQTWLNPKLWVQPKLGNLSTIVGWKGPNKGPRRNPFSSGPVDLDSLAFAAGTPNRAPDAGPDEDPETPGVGTQFREFPPSTPEDTRTAQLYIRYYNLHNSNWHIIHESWTGAYLAASRIASWSQAAGTAGIGTGVVPGLAAGNIMHQFPASFLARNRFVSKAAPLLAVRAARRGVRASPEDATAYLVLAKAYLLLWKGHEELWSLRVTNAPLSFQDLEFAFRESLREVQIVTALNRAVALKPSLVEAHLLLADVYRQMHYLDAALHHMEQAVKHYTDERPSRRPLEDEEDFEKRLKNYKRELKSLKEGAKVLKKDVTERTNDFRLQAAEQLLKRKVELALVQPYRTQRFSDNRGRGLALKALDLLLKARMREIWVDEATWQVRLLISLGRMKEVRERLEDLRSLLRKIEKEAKANARLRQWRRRLGFSIAWYEVLVAGADGDYVKVDQALEKLRMRSRVPPLFMQVSAGQILQGFILSAKPASDDPRRLGLTGLLPLLNRQIMQGLQQLVSPLRAEAELHLLSGLMALEHGYPEKAAAYFHQCLKRSRDLDGPGFAYPDKRIADHYLAEMKKVKK